MAADKDDGRKVVAENRKARHEYFITDDYEAGIMLTGTEVKSLRKGHAQIGESYASVEDGGLWLINAHIPEYSEAGRFFQHEPRRTFSACEIIGRLQGIHCGGVVSGVITGNTRCQVGIGVWHEPRRLRAAAL